MNTSDQASWLLHQRQTTLLAATADFHLTRYHTKSQWAQTANLLVTQGTSTTYMKKVRPKKEFVGEMNPFDLLMS